MVIEVYQDVNGAICFKAEKCNMQLGKEQKKMAITLAKNLHPNINTVTFKDFYY